MQTCQGKTNVFNSLASLISFLLGENAFKKHTFPLVYISRKHFISFHFLLCINLRRLCCELAYDIYSCFWKSNYPENVHFPKIYSGLHPIKRAKFWDNGIIYWSNFFYVSSLKIKFQYNTENSYQMKIESVQQEMNRFLSFKCCSIKAVNQL